MDISENVPLPKKLTTPLPELPKMIPPPPGDIDQGVALPKKLTNSPPQQVPLKQPEISLSGRKIDPGFDPSGAPAIRVFEEVKKPTILTVPIKRPVNESARLPGGGIDLLKIKEDAEEKRKTFKNESPYIGVDLPPKLRAQGNREEKVFEPAGSSIPAFVASPNTAIKLSENGDWVKGGPVPVSKCGVSFDAPKIGEPMMRRVKIVWPTPMEKASAQPSAPFKGAGEASRKLQGMESKHLDSFPGQNMPTGGQPVQLKARDEKVSKSQVPMPKRPEPVFIGLQDPPRFLPRELGPGEGRPSVDEILAAAQKKVEDLIKKTAGSSGSAAGDILSELAQRAPESVLAQIATRAQAVMEREAKAKDIEAENDALREIVKTLGGKVALYEVEIQILKAKKG